jgi:hypothetical protein
MIECVCTSPDVVSPACLYCRPFWYCNKCWRVGDAPTREAATEAHDALEPKCNYLPAWEDPNEA